MNPHYILPVCFAAAAHGALLFGFTKTPRRVSVEQPETARIPFVVRELEDTVLIVSDAEPTKPAAARVPEAPRIPRRPELDPAVDLGDRPTMKPTLVHRADAKDMRGILEIPPGLIDGGGGSTPVGTDIFDSGKLDKSPRTRLQVAPVYPFEAKRTGMSGEVWVKFTVDEHGDVVEPRIVHSSDRIFEESTLRAVAKWRFEPGRRDGKIVRFRMLVPVTFNLNETL